MQAFFCMVFLACGAMLLGCGSDDSESPPPPPEVECDSVSVPTYSEVRAFDVCTNCHSSQVTDRNGAPSNVNFDTYEGAKLNSKAILTQVSSNIMPPVGSGFSLTAEEKQELYAWIECGTPE